MDIMNSDWYNRLIQGIRNQTSSAIRGSGSRADDPYWKAKEGQGITDVNNERQQALAAMMDRASANRGQGYAEDAAYQRRATWGLNNR